MRVAEQYARRQRRTLTRAEAAEIFGITARTLRRWSGRYDIQGAEGVQDRRLGQAVARAVPVDDALRKGNLRCSLFQDSGLAVGCRRSLVFPILGCSHWSGEKKRRRVPAVGSATEPSTHTTRASCGILDAAGWRFYLSFEQRQVTCSRCQGARVGAAGLADAESPRYTPVRSAGRHRVSGHVEQGRGPAAALHAHTVQDLDSRYMQAWLAKMLPQAPQVIGIDELSITRGHTYRIVVSDLKRGRPIWVGGIGRTEGDSDRFFVVLGLQKTARIRLTVLTCG